MDELEILIQAILKIDKEKSIKEINKGIEALEKQIKKLKLQATLDNGKSKTEIQKQIEILNKQKKRLYVDLQLRKDTLKKQYQELQKESNLSLSINTEIAQRQIKNVSNVMGDTKNETIGLGLALKNAFSNAGLIMTSQRALSVVRRAINEVTQAVKEYDEYTKNLKIITNKDDVSDLIADYATKSIDMKIDIGEYETASEVILRAGKNLAESTEYTESAIKLAKTGFIETDTAAENLIVIANSYDLTADKLKNVTDALLTLDVKTNTEAGALSSAMAKSAKNAQLAGLSYEQLGATIAKLRDTTGKSETEISTALNNIFNRTYRVKPNAFTFENENGETEDLSKALSDVDKVMSQLGISIRKSATEFKSFEEIISTIAPIWKDLDTVSQNAVSSVFAGQHKNVFLNLVNDWQDIVELTKTAENSINATEQKYEAYLDSLEAKSAEFSTTTKEMWNHLVPKSFIGDITEAGTSLIRFVDNYQILQSALKSVTFYALAKGAITAKNSLVGMVTDIKNVSTAFTQLENVQKSSIGTQEYKNNIKALGKTVSSLTDNQTKLLLSTKSLSDSQKIAILKATGLGEAEAKAKLQTLGLAQANQTATASTFSLSGSIKALWSILEANPILVLTAAFTAFSAIQQKVQRENEEMKESAVEAIKQYDEQAQSLEDLRQKYIDIVDSEDSTAKKTEELNKWKQTLIETYGLEKEAIEKVNLAREDGLKLIDDEIIKNKINSAETWLTDNKEAYKNAQKKLLGANNSTETAVIPRANIIMNIDKSALDNYSENFDDIMKQLTIKNPTKDNPLAQIKIQGSNVLQQYENLSKILNEITSIEVTKGLNKSEQELYDALLKKQAEYKKVVTDDIKDIVENGKKYTSMIQLYNFETDSGINFENVSEDTYKQFRDKFLESLGYGYKKDSEDFSLDVEKILLDMLPDLENSYRGIEITDIIDTTNADEISENIDNVTSSLDNLTDKYNELSKSAESYTKAQKTLTDALKEQEEHGQLSASTIQSLADAGYSQALTVDKETGAVTLNTEAYERLNEQKKQKLKLDLEQQNTDLQDKIKEEESIISSLKKEYEALAKANAEANAERLKEIEIEITARSQDEARLRELVDKNNAAKIGLDAPTFEKSDNKDLWKEEAEKKFADLEHLYAMDKISYASYLNQMDKLNQHYYGNNEKYIDDFYKYEEKVYQGRKKLAEDLLEEEEKTQKAYHDNRISELEAKITVTTNDSVDDQGNKLNASEKFDYLRAIYDEILKEIERRENEIVQSGVEGHETELAELSKKYEEYANKKADIFKSEIQYEMDYISELEKKYDDFIDKRIERYEDEKKAIEDRYDSEIKAIDKTIDSLKDKNNEAQNALNLKKAEQDLEKSRQRTRMTYGSDGRIIYKQDDEAIAEAQQKVNDIKLDMIINNLEKQKEGLEEQKDIEVDKYDDMITVLTEQKDIQEKYFETLTEILSNYSNPKATENIQSVWDRIFADKENVTVKDTTVNVNGSNIDTSPAVFGEIDSDKVNQTLDKANEVIENLKDDKTKKVGNADDFIAQMLHTLGVKIPDGKRVDDVLKNLTWGSNSYNPAQTVVDTMNNNIRKITQSANVKPSVNVGNLSLNIQTPVGTIEDIAKHAATGVLERAERQALMEIPNVFMKGIYNNLK